MKKNQEGSDMTEVNGSAEDVTQDEDWGQAQLVWTSMSTCLWTRSSLHMEEMCGVVGSGSCVEEGQGDGGVDNREAESKPVPSFLEALHAFESMRAFMYVHDITKRDQVNIVNIERLLFSLKRKGATKQMSINGFF
jgi:hypothetical protein